MAEGDINANLDPEVTDVAWAILRALHENVPEADRPMSWSDVNGDQEQRIRAAALAAIECLRARDEASREPIVFVTAAYFPGTSLRCTVRSATDISVERADG